MPGDGCRECLTGHRSSWVGHLLTRQILHPAGNAMYEPTTERWNTRCVHDTACSVASRAAESAHHRSAPQMPSRGRPFDEHLSVRQVAHGLTAVSTCPKLRFAGRWQVLRILPERPSTEYSIGAPSGRPVDAFIGGAMRRKARGVFIHG